MIFNFFKKKKKTEEKKFGALVNEIKALKDSIDDCLFVITDNESEFLPEQTADFMEKAEFAMTSTIQCLYMAVDNKKNALLKAKVKELSDGTNKEKSN